MVRQTLDVDGGQLGLYEGQGVGQELVGHRGVVGVDPLQRDLLLEVCDLADRVQARAALVRRIGDAVQRDHLAGVALKRGLGSGAADLIRFGDVGAARQVARAALQRRKLDAAGLGVQTAGNGVRQEARRAGQSLVAERIHRVDIVG